MGLEAFRAESGGPRIGFVGYWESCTERVAFDGVEKYRHRVVPVLAEISLVGRYRLSELPASDQPGVEI